jgi:PAS domain S-box-containing protein
VTPPIHGQDPPDSPPKLDRLVVALALAPWLTLVAAALVRAQVTLQLGALALAIVCTAIANALRTLVAHVPERVAAPRAVREEAGSEAGRVREAIEERDAAMAEQMRLFDQLAGAQIAAADAERRVALAVHSGNFGVWEVDLRSRQAYFSPGFRERLGLETANFTGDLEWFGTHVHADDREAWREAVREHLESHTSYSLDVRLRIASGEHRLFRARGQAEWNLAGEPSRLSGSLQDITERRFTEQRLRESEESFRSLSAASPVGILKADAGGECVWCNDRWQEISGCSEFEAMGTGWLDAVHPDDAAAVAGAWNAFVREGGVFDTEFRIRRADEQLRHARSRANAVLDDHGAVTAFVATVEDVTEERDAALALAEARDRAMRLAAAKSEFLANMSHEIRTPLNGVIGMTELLQNTELDAEQRDFVRTINGSAESLLGIINDILDYSKIEAGKMRLERVNLDLRSIAEDVAEMLAPVAHQAGLELVVAVGSDVPRPIVGDPVRLRQILSNLASNAIKFTEKGEVVLSATCLERQGDQCRLRIGVRDTGIGIPPERLHAVFESFTQADGSTTRKYGGTGLGLTICRQLARLMDGTIQVSSEVGVGSEFWIEVSLGVGTSERELPKANVDLSGLRALVVDDHPVNRRIFTETLLGWGMRVEAVEGGDEALARVAADGTDPYAVVLMDYRMPGPDGLVTAERMRDLPGADRRTVMILSSVGAVDASTDLRRQGVNLWLTKPVREAALNRAVSSLLGRGGEAVKAAVNLDPVHEFADLAVLLVEDNEVNRKVALHMLHKLGCAADVAVNGREGVDRIAERPYDLVFMDCQMPEMDGFEATREVRRREQASGGSVRIVAMTANALEGDRERCLDCGMDDYVAKPIKLDYLVEQLRAARSLRRAA